MWSFYGVNTERISVTTTGLDWTYNCLLSGTTVTRRRTETGNRANRMKIIRGASSTAGMENSKINRAVNRSGSLARHQQVSYLFLSCTLSNSFYTLSQPQTYIMYHISCVLSASYQIVKTRRLSLACLLKRRKLRLMHLCWSVDVST